MGSKAESGNRKAEKNLCAPARNTDWTAETLRSLRAEKIFDFGCLIFNEFEIGGLVGAVVPNRPIFRCGVARREPLSLRVLCVQGLRSFSGGGSAVKIDWTAESASRKLGSHGALRSLRVRSIFAFRFPLSEFRLSNSLNPSALTGRSWSLMGKA